MSRSNYQIRNNSIFLTDEVMFYLHIKAKAMVQGTEVAITEDQVGNGMLRKVLTEEHPELVAMWEEKNEIKGESKKKYESLEERAISAVGRQV